MFGIIGKLRLILSFIGRILRVPFVVIPFVFTRCLMDLHSMLSAARKKADAALAVVKESEHMLETARKRGMKILASNTEENLKRQRQALSRAEGLVVELEKEAGQLPLGKAGKA